MIFASRSSGVAIYARFSTARQDARSIDDQVRRCRAFAEQRRLEVVEVFVDAAQSGAHMERIGLQRLLKEARGKRCRFGGVLVDDLSRLSRDLGNTWQIVFRDLLGVQVVVTDVSTGTASNGNGARIQFGALGLVNDTFLQLIKSETTRGLEGRALAGFWTGGRVFGYRTVKEENPPDPEHPRAVPVIDVVEAATVRRVFELYAEGHGLRQIAGMLNREGLAAPYDRGYRKRAGRGWPSSTIRAMLNNARYVGEWAWKKREWFTNPETGARTPRFRESDQWITTDRPGLAIVPRELWGRVQARFAARKGTLGRPHGTGQAGHLLSQLLRCGECGSTMRIVSTKKKAGRRYSNYGCSAHWGKGDAICSNGMVISELKVNRTVLSELGRIVGSGEIEARMLEAFQERLRERPKEAAPERSTVERELKTQEARVRNVTAALAKTGFSEALGEQLRVEEERMRSLRVRLSGLDDAGDSTPPSPDVLTGYLEDALKTAEKTPRQAREALARVLTPITLAIVEDAEGTRRYEARGALNTNPAVLSDSRVVVNGGCGGPISPFPETRPRFRVA